MRTDFSKLAMKAAGLMLGTLFFAGQGVHADPVSTPAIGATTPSRDELAAALRASGNERPVADALDTDPAKDAAAASKANADRRAALAALGLQTPQAQQQRQAAPSQGQGGATGSPGPTAKDGDHTGSEPGAPDPLKEAVRPMYEEISKSGIVDAVRSLKVELTPEKDRPAADGNGVADAAHANKPKEAGAPGVDNTLWAAPGEVSRVSDGPPPRSAAQIKQDQMLANAAFEKLIDDVKPWALGLLVLMLLGLGWKMVLGYLRMAGQRRRRRRFGHSTTPRRTQY